MPLMQIPRETKMDRASVTDSVAESKRIPIFDFTRMIDSYLPRARSEVQF
jgi:hypothetical protein